MALGSWWQLGQHPFRRGALGVSLGLQRVAVESLELIGAGGGLGGIGGLAGLGGLGGAAGVTKQPKKVCMP
jgi:hypothetical protein